VAALTLAVTLIVFFGSFFSYWILYEFFPGSASETLIPSGVDWLLMLLLLTPPLVIAGIVSINLARKILAPLLSLAAAANEIADGNLYARAEVSPGTSVEISKLVLNFNHMADTLQDTAESMSVWNAAVAHEIRTPLTVLKGRVQGLIDGVFVADQVLFQGLMLQIDGLARLTDDLRTMTLADSGRLDLRVAQISISDEIVRMVDLVRPSLEGGGFTLELNLSDLTVSADPMRIRQVLLALLTNVEHHAFPGPVRITCKRSGRMAVVRIEDSGPGLPAHFIKRVFKPFMRLEMPTARERNGSGLGLAVVRAIALAHGGQAVYRRSELGGSAFSIKLPLAGNANGEDVTASGVSQGRRYGAWRRD
jgi:two-component system sensor histidine kinase AdeS